MAANGRRPSIRDIEFSRTVRELSPWLERRLARHFGLFRSDIDDLVQESFVRLHRYDVADRSRHPRALLWRIAGNVARDAFRREAARGIDRTQPLDEGLRDRIGQAADQFETLALKDAILALPDPLRAVFLLARFTPMTNAEIARHLDISIKTVEWRLAKATLFCLDRLAD